MIVWGRNLSSTAILEYDPRKGQKTLRAYGIDFGRFALLIVRESNA